MTKVSRRGFISGIKSSIEKHSLERTAAKAPIRPPHAAEEIEFLSLCETGCEKCVQACPYGSIYILQTEDADDGTPILAPEERPCHLCEDIPCVLACPSGALNKEYPLQKFGYVEILEEHCFTFRGPECGACNLCPRGIKGISFSRNRPSIDREQCVGCGMCIDACPTTPVSFQFFKSVSLYERGE